MYLGQCLLFFINTKENILNFYKVIIACSIQNSKLSIITLSMLIIDSYKPNNKEVFLPCSKYFSLPNYNR